ncbi:MAG TPA: hypothetical protein DCP28_31195, partial [Cytophagales bacterium]|nr:hypothetical protein [Cytophagales bacterium]
ATATAVPYSESFEGGTGVWNQASCDDIDWTRDANGTPSSGTGPSSGSAGSWYMYVEVSGNGTGYPNKDADLFAAFDLSGTSSPEISFDYHANGNAVGTLNLDASTDGVNFVNLWTISGSQGGNWNSATVDLSGYAGSTVTLRFAATSASSWQGDIAIDNLSIAESGGGGGGGGGGTTDDCGNANGISASTGAFNQYTWNVPAGTQELVVSISGGTGDADLYVRQAAAPTTSSYDCRPYLNGNNETCTFQNPTPGT